MTQLVASQRWNQSSSPDQVQASRTVPPTITWTVHASSERRFLTCAPASASSQAAATLNW
jgi:hypothetical protein